MFGRKRRFVSLALIMVLLVGAVSVFSTRLLYQTSLDEQRVRLHELVTSQASLVTELGWVALELQLLGGPEKSGESILQRLGRAHTKFQIESNYGEFTVAKRVGDTIRFLIVNGKPVLADNPLAVIPLDGPLAEPMHKALAGNSGTMIGRDYKGVEVLAAYTPLFFQYEVVGLVAKIDIDAIKAPFIKANFIIFGVGLGVTLLCLALFFKVSEPIIRDIQQSEKKYRDLVEGASSLIVRIDESGAITFANSFARSKLVGENDTLVGKMLMPFLTHDNEKSDLDAVMAFFWESDVHNELPIRFFNESKGWVSWTVRLIADNDQPRELLCIGNDVTNVHLANEAQREIEERFRGIAKASPVGLAITDMEGNLFYANERMHELTMTTAVDLSGRGWLERIHVDDRASIKKQWLGGKTKPSSQVELRLMTKKNSEIWVLGQMVELLSIQGEAVGNVLTFTDITPIKEAELATRRLAAAIEQAAEMVIITDINGIITYANPAFEAVTGYTQRDIVGKNPNFLSSGEQGPDFYKNLWGTIARDEVWSGRFVNLKKNGKRYTQEATIGSIRNQTGEVIGYVEVARDISNQLVAEAQLRQSQKLESIGELAAGIAHEINTPTQYVTTNLQFLGDAFASYSKMLERSEKLIGFIEKRCQESPDEELQREADIVLDRDELMYLAEDIPNALAESELGLKRIAEIVQSVKQLAHPGEVSKSFHSLNEIARDAATVSTNEWRYVADMVFDLDETLPSVHCLKGEVGQVVLNLIVNGAHAIEAKGVDDGNRGTITLKTYKDGDMAVLEVSDTGSGMAQEVVDRAFDPFFTTKEVGKGTGQGLAIAHNVVVNMHEGHVSISTEQGKGSTFIVQLPFEERD